MKDDIIAALVKEIGLRKDYLENKNISTIYFGGGTPSILEPNDLEAIISSIECHFNISENVEITLEANPDDLNPKKLKELNNLGINRLSIGIQTFDDEYLRYLNRAHDHETAINCVKSARKSGFQNISIDLIYAIKEDNHSTLLSDLGVVRSLEPEHISAYCLTIEPKTALGNWLKKGKIKSVSEEYAALEFELLMESLEKMGYEQYEISNFSRQGYFSRHNSSYWKHIPYLGIGPSAHSYNGEMRQFNVANNAKYLKAIAQDIIPCEKEALDKKNLVNERIMTGLRTKWGCNLLQIKDSFGLDLLQINREMIDQYILEDLINLRDNTLFLTRSGKLLADEIASRLFLV